MGENTLKNFVYLPNRFAVNNKIRFSQGTVPFMSYFLEYLFIDVFEKYLCVNDLISCTCSPDL